MPTTIAMAIWAPVLRDTALWDLPEAPAAFGSRFAGLSVLAPPGSLKSDMREGEGVGLEVKVEDWVWASTLSGRAKRARRHSLWRFNIVIEDEVLSTTVRLEYFEQMDIWKKGRCAKGEGKSQSCLSALISGVRWIHSCSETTETLVLLTASAFLHRVRTHSIVLAIVAQR